MPNPLFPFHEYIPDGEPHVFADRIYLYGSHDQEDGTRFCMLDYTLYSAPTHDLSNWKNHGIIYRKDQDPRSKNGKLVDYYAPDCVKGNDGRYYLYYFAAGPNTKPFGPMAVAVSEQPDGPFAYLHDLVNQDGTPLLRYLTNDPCAINDHGHIYLYYGWGLGRDFRGRLLSPLFNFVLSKLLQRDTDEIKNTKPSILSCAFVELEDDMYTVKRGPIPVLDSKTTADKNSELYHHPFYEAPSIRKINDLYYLIYSSGENNELAYATSRYPDRDFRYQGVIISNSDIGYQGNKKAKAFGDTIHGSIERIDDRWYVFYHRLTRNSNFSRQACAEPIEIGEDGRIPQVEITSTGIDGKPFIAEGRYSSFLACNIFHKKRKTKLDEAMFTKEGDQYVIKNIKNGFVVGYKYFDFKGDETILVSLKGNKGKIRVSDGENDAYMLIEDSSVYRTYEIKAGFQGVKPLYLEYIGKGNITLLEIGFKGGRYEENSL